MCPPNPLPLRHQAFLRPDTSLTCASYAVHWGLTSPFPSAFTNKTECPVLPPLSCSSRHSPHGRFREPALAFRFAFPNPCTVIIPCVLVSPYDLLSTIAPSRYRHWVCSHCCLLFVPTHCIVLFSSVPPHPPSKTLLHLPVRPHTVDSGRVLSHPHFPTPWVLVQGLSDVSQDSFLTLITSRLFLVFNSLLVLFRHPFSHPPYTCVFVTFPLLTPSHLTYSSRTREMFRHSPLPCPPPPPYMPCTLPPLGQAFSPIRCRTSFSSPPLSYHPPSPPFSTLGGVLFPPCSTSLCPQHSGDHQRYLS